MDAVDNLLVRGRHGAVGCLRAEGKRRALSRCTIGESWTNWREVDDGKDVREYLRTLGGVIRQPADSAACYDLQWRKRSIRDWDNMCVWIHSRGDGSGNVCNDGHDTVEIEEHEDLEEILI